MMKPKDYTTSLKSLKIQKHLKLHLRLLHRTKIKIQDITTIENKKQWKKYQGEYNKFILKNHKRPFEKLMFHITNLKNAKEISNDGFSIKKSKMKAFGRGVNLCPSLKDVIHFHKIYKNKNDLYSIIVCRVVYFNSHSNSSDDSKVVTNPDGSYFTSPKYMKPKRGFDCMFSKHPYKKIWVIPSSSRVYPAFLINIKIKNTTK